MTQSSAAGGGAAPGAERFTMVTGLPHPWTSGFDVDHAASMIRAARRGGNPVHQVENRVQIDVAFRGKGERPARSRSPPTVSRRQPPPHHLRRKRTERRAPASRRAGWSSWLLVSVPPRSLTPRKRNRSARVRIPAATALMWDTRLRSRPQKGSIMIVRSGDRHRWVPSAVIASLALIGATLAGTNVATGDIATTSATARTRCRTAARRPPSTRRCASSGRSTWSGPTRRWRHSRLVRQASPPLLTGF